MSAGLYDVGGSSRVMEQLGSKLVEKGHDVTIGALWFRRLPPKGGYNICSIPFSNIIALRRFLDNFDIVHSHHAITNYLALVKRKPFVYHYHGAPNFGRGSLFALSMISSIKMTKHTLDVVVAVSESGAAELKRCFNLDNVSVVYNGVDTQLLKPVLEEKFRKGIPQFLFVGNLYEHKKAEELIFAMKKLVKVYPNAYLQIVGNGQAYRVLKRFVTKLKLENHVELVGRVSETELPYRYASCDAYVTASHWELFGLPLLEAMACGKPVIASSILAHAELIVNSQAGELYPVGDVDTLCKKMILTFEEREKYADNAISFAKEHDWSVVADRISRIYTHML
jgi:glycosyltransferase involved in cell wall biosynthesis